MSTGHGEANRRILITLAVVLGLSAVVAAAVIFSSGGDEPAPPQAAVAMRAAGTALVMGPARARHTVVLYEDFLCRDCRELESSTRSFLRDYARQGTVQVQYRPFHLLRDPYSTRALTAWSAVLEKGSAEQAYRFHNTLYDDQPDEADPSKPGVDELRSMARHAGVGNRSVLAAMGHDNVTFVDEADLRAKAAGVTGTPTVFLDGEEVHGASMAQLADHLESGLARR